MDEKQFKDLVEKVGQEAANQIKTRMEEFEKRFKEMAAGNLTQEQFTEHKTAISGMVEEVKEIARKQGTTINEILAKMDGTDVKGRSIAATLKADEAELREVFKSRNRQKEYMLTENSKGEIVMSPFDSTKVAGLEATIDNVPAGNVAAITQNIDAATLLRLGADANIFRQFRNTPWLYDLVNLINTGFNTPYYIWMDEQPKVGASTTVLEGGTKPLVQYKYQVNSSPYKKEACLVQFTEEFSLDFQRLQSEILNVAKIDLVNRINDAILADIIAQATPFNIAATYAPSHDNVLLVNGYDAIAAMAAQVEMATFSTLLANTAIMSTIKKYRLGTLKDTLGRWLNAPEILNRLAFVSNPVVATDQIIVGDLKQYNVALRGGIIVRVGYNGTDFAENKFSTVVEQYYFNYISTIRKPAIVKGPNFKDVMDQIKDYGS